jgi:putative nucleotidyltransferase with HDIG domain
MGQNVVELFPEINLINDESIREKIKAGIEDALNWGWKDLAAIPYINSWEPEVRYGISLVEHTRLVTNLMIAMAKELEKTGYKINFDELIAAGILHDFGLLMEFEEKNGKIVQRWNQRLIRHPHWGMWLAQKNDLPVSVVHAISSHSKEGDFTDRNQIALILYHADWLVWGLLPEGHTDS